MMSKPSSGTTRAHAVETLTIRRNCPVCSSDSSQMHLWTFKEMTFYFDAPGNEPIDVTTVQCSECFAIFMNPVYSEHGLTVLFSAAGASYGGSQWLHADRVRWLEEIGLLRDSALILDVGCYDGSFLRELPKEVQRVGIDADAPAISRAQEADVDGTYLVGRNLEPVRKSEIAPDLVTLIHVLEHVVDPVALLREVRSILGSSSRVFIEVPLLNCATVGDCQGFFSNQHLTHFTHTSLRSVIERAGFEIETYVVTEEVNGTRVIAAPKRQLLQGSTQSGNPMDLTLSYDYLSQYCVSLASLSEQLGRVPADSNLVVWGAGMHTSVLQSLFGILSRWNIVMLVDSDLSKIGHTWRGIPIQDPSSLRLLDWSTHKLLISSFGSEEEIARAAGLLGVPETHVLLLYDDSTVSLVEEDA